MAMKKILLIISLVILSGCMKQHCVGPDKCDKKVDWNNPGFTVLRTIVTQGANAGN